MAVSHLGVFILYRFVCLCCYVDNTCGCRKPLADPCDVSPFMCTYVDDLLSNGIDTIEALQNMNCCKDARCKFHSAY